jgi:hypothetical protein
MLSCPKQAIVTQPCMWSPTQHLNLGSDSMKIQFSVFININGRACSSIVGWGTMLQTGLSQVQFLVRPLHFLNLPKPNYCSRVCSASYRNEYRRIFLGVKCGWCMRHPHCQLWADYIENAGLSTSQSLWVSMARYKDTHSITSYQHQLVKWF